MEASAAHADDSISGGVVQVVDGLSKGVEGLGKVVLGAVFLA